MAFMANLVPDTVSARAPLGAFAVAAGLMFLGLVGSLMTLSLVMLTSVVGQMEPGLQSLSRMAYALLAAFASCSLAGLGGILLAAQSRAGVAPDGRFRVRSWPPWRVRTIDLAGLERIRARQGAPRRRGLMAATRHSTVLSLQDGSGTTVHWNPAFWRGSEQVTEALRDAAVLSGAMVDYKAVDVLDNPPFGD